MGATHEAGSTAVTDDDIDLCQRGAVLRVLSGQLRGHIVKLSKQAQSIGKSDGCDLVLSDESVSRIHAEIRYELGRYHLVDFDSTNGTFVGGSRIASAWLTPGDVVRLGTVELHFLPVGQPVELLPSEANHFGRVVGQSLAMRRMFAVLERVADSEVSILLCGEPGTGKDLTARSIHEASSRRERALVVFDCAELEQIELELFGNGRGGALAAAEGGSLFLDTVDQLPTPLRSRLWHALDHGDVDVRLIGAAGDGADRGEGLAGLFSVCLRLPPLRERRDDIPMLIERFSRRLPPGLWTAPASDAMARLLGYVWPGNLRELRNVIERSVYLSPAGKIDLLAPGTDEELTAEFDPTLTFSEHKERVMEHFEQSYFRWLLTRAGGNISRAARDAGMDRKHLHHLLRRYQIAAKRFQR